MKIVVTDSLVARFWSHVDRSGECWTWTASKNRRGYGWFVISSGYQRGAHRVSWWIAFGAIPDGQWVLHRCDNPPCVRPDHLLLGTNIENSADRDAKGRGFIPHGEECGSSVLTAEQVYAIRSSGGRSRDVAKEFGVSHFTVNDIRARRTWRHLIDKAVRS